MDIVKYPNQILSQKIEQVIEINQEIRSIIAQMKTKMIESKGVGLAANQVNINLAIFVIDKDLAKEHKVPEAYINPLISEHSKENSYMEEGCLSLPDQWMSIKRPKKIYLRALDENGNRVKIKARGFLSRVYQHETDHLNGLLIKDRLEK